MMNVCCSPDAPGFTDTMFAGLEILGKPAQLVAYDGRDHNVPGHSDYWPRIMEWFDTFVRDRGP